jgi:hypothetical protein
VTDTIVGWRQRLAESRSRLVAAMAGLPDPALTRPWRWRDRDDEVRYALLRAADDDQEALVAVHEVLADRAWRQPEPARLLALAEISRGALLGALVGVTDAQLDPAPARDEWPLREVLAHIVLTERRYYQRTAWHVEAARAGHGATGEPPTGIVEPMSEVGLYARGGVTDFEERLATAREEALAVLADVQPVDLNAPAGWAGYTVDVRFRLHRFAAHEREHTGQVQATLRAIGFVPSEAQRVLATAQVTRGHLLAALVGLPDDLLDATSSSQGASVAGVLRRLETLDQKRIDSVLAAVAG